MTYFIELEVKAEGNKGIMGGIFGKAMDENLKKNQEFMLTSQRAQLERQMAMQNSLREQQMAIQLARGRDLFHWWAAFFAVAATGSLAGFRKTKKPVTLVPLLPLTFIVGYLGDMAYGSKLERIKAEAGRILESEMQLLDLPRPLPTIEDLDRQRDELWKHD